MATPVEQLVASRGGRRANATARINSLTDVMTDFTANPAPHKIPIINHRYKSAEKAMDRLRDIHDELVGLLNQDPETAEARLQIAYIQEMETAWERATDDYATILAAATAPPPQDPLAEPPPAPAAPDLIAIMEAVSGAATTAIGRAIGDRGERQAQVVWSSTFKLKDHLKKFDGKEPKKYQAFIQAWAPLNDRMEEMGLVAVERFNQLKTCLEGEALKAVENLPYANPSLEQALRILNGMYGDPQLTINSLIEELKNCRQMGYEAKQIKEFYLAVHGTYQSMLTMGMAFTEQATINMFASLVELKLNNQAAREWAKIKLRSRDAAGEPNWTLQQLMDMLKEATLIAEDLKGRPSTRSKTHSTQQGKPSSSTLAGNFSTQIPGNALVTGFGVSKGQGGKKPYPPCLFCNETDHSHYICPKAKEMGPQACLNIVNQKKACKCCFRIGHTTKDCRSKERNLCKKCRKEHHTLLHLEATAPRSSNAMMLNCQSTGLIVKSNNQKYWPAVHIVMAMARNPLNLYGTDQVARVMLDSGSQVTLVSPRLVQALKLEETATGTMRLRTLGGDIETSTKKYDITLVPGDGKTPNLHIEALAHDGPIEVSSDDGTLVEVDILLGEPYWSDVVKYKIPAPPGQPVTWMSIFGPFLGRGKPVFPQMT